MVMVAVSVILSTTNCSRGEGIAPETLLTKSVRIN